MRPWGLLAACALLGSLPAAAASSDETWMRFLVEPPPVAVALADELTKAAEDLAAGLPDTLAVAGDVDVAISGGGNLDAYYVGVHMILARAKSLRVHRHAGASAGGMTPFEIALKGERATLLTHLSYGVLCSMYPDDFSNVVSSVLRQDHHWRMMARWQTDAYAQWLHLLDGRIVVALSCLTPLPTLVNVSNFTAEGGQATHAFVATGTFLELYDGLLCTDGGWMSGKKMTPLFQDKQRPQILVDLMQTGYPTTAALPPENLTQYVELIRQGQREAVDFLATGRCRANALTLCPRDAKVDTNVCEAAEPPEPRRLLVWT